METESKSTVHRITAKTMTSWFFAALAVFNAFGAVVYGHLSLLLFVVAFIVAYSPAYRFVKRKLRVDLSTGARAIIYTVATVVGNFWFLSAVVT